MLRSELKPAKDFAFYCVQFIDLPEGEYQFQIRAGTEIAFEHKIALVAETVLQDYHPKAVFANTSFTLHLNFTKQVKEVKLGHTLY